MLAAHAGAVWQEQCGAQAAGNVNNMGLKSRCAARSPGSTHRGGVQGSPGNACSRGMTWPVAYHTTLRLHACVGTTHTHAMRAGSRQLDPVHRTGAHNLSGLTVHCHFMKHTTPLSPLRAVYD